MEDERTPIYWHSNAPWMGTGYGTQTALFGPRVGELLDYDVAFGAFAGLKGNRQLWQAPNGKPHTIYPGGSDPYANDVVGAHAKHWFADRGGMVFMLTDPWVMSAEIMGRLPTIAWVPVDHDPLIPDTKRWFKESSAVPLAMSRFGERVLTDAGFDPLYCPHGFDQTVWHPGDRKAAREALQLPQDAFLVGMVAANVGYPSRKGFQEAFRAFSRFQANYPDAKLYLHTRLQSPEGENLVAMAEHMGIQPLASDQYALTLGTPPGLVALLMQSFDVLLNPSYGEGFGCTMVESQACGTPVITTDFSASPEVAPRDAGNWNVGGVPRWTWFESDQLQPDVGEIEDALVECYEEATADRHLRRLNVADFARATYEADYVTTTYMKPALEEAYARLCWRDQQLSISGR